MPDQIDMLWVLVCSALVMLMQAGFTMLEAGLSRAKNSINVAAKNLTDFCISAVLFWLVGFGLMFGSSKLGLVGSNGFMPSGLGTPELITAMLFQMMFCATAATIISGAVAERMRFGGYLIVVLAIALLFYPVFGHWSWGGYLLDEKVGWLERIGFVDFAGATVVHGVGGWLALAAVLVVGPRKGRYEGGQKSIKGHSLVMACCGGLILLFGWFGFNGGSTGGMTEAVPLILLNTILAAMTGLLMAMFLSRIFQRLVGVEHLVIGMISGLVAITACAHAVSLPAAALIGAVGGSIGYFGTRLLNRLQIDDVVASVPCHAFAGVWGTLAFAIFAQPQMLTEGLGRWEQLGIQALGVGVCFAWAFGLGYVVLGSINRVFPLRVSEADEMRGLNVAEHGATTELIVLLNQMHDHSLSDELERDVDVEPYTEVGQIATLYNRVLERVRGHRDLLGEQAVELEQALVAANASSETKSRFLANMSHEIRTPMTAILGYTDLLLEPNITAADRSNFIHTIQSNGKHLLRLINDILDISKVEAGQMTFEKTTCSPQGILHEVSSLMSVRAHDKGLQLDVEYIGPIPKQIQGDALRIRQVLINLVGNGIKFTERGGVRIVVRLSRHNGVDLLGFEVVDTGIGMTQQQIGRLFKAFEQADDTMARRFGGTGLGLALSRQMAVLMGGDIIVQSAPGRGSSFIFTTPTGSLDGVELVEQSHDALLGLDKSCVEEPNSKPKDSARQTPTDLGRPIRVLLVEDGRENQRLIQFHLKKAGFESEIADNGEVGKQKFLAASDSGKPYDVVLSDMQMPIMDGYTMARELRDAGVDVPIIALTAHAMSEDRQKCIEAGCTDFATKPIDARKLTEMVLHHAGQRDVAETALP